MTVWRAGAAILLGLLILAATAVRAQTPAEIGRDLVVRSQQAALEGDPERATRLLYEGLTYPLEEGLLDSLLADLADIVGERERKAYEQARNKGLFFQRLWRSLDPTPATPENERYVEHYQRLDYARKNFAATLSRGYDDRGMIYVRYGPPDDRYLSPASSFTRATESWVYYRLGNANFDFVEFGASYRLESDFQKALIAVPADERDRARMIRDLIAPRSELGLAYSRLADELDRELQSVDQGLKPFERELVSRLINDYTTSVEQQHEKLPTSAADLDVEEHPLTFWLSYGRFRLDRHRSRVELYFGVPFRNLVFQPDTSGTLRSELVNYFRVENSLHDVVLEDKQTYLVEAASEAAIDTMDYVGQLTLFLPPDTFRIGFELRNPAGDKRQFYTLRLAVPPVDPLRLAVSDLQFAEVIRPAPPIRHGTSRGFVKGDLYVEPYPYVHVPRSKVLNLYFEIYNLALDDDGRSRYRVEYELVGEKAGSGLLSVLGSINPFGKGEKTSSSTAYDRQGTRRDEAERITFHFSEFKEGVYTLRVRVLDRVSGQMAESARRLRLVE